MLFGLISFGEQESTPPPPPPPRAFFAFSHIVHFGSFQYQDGVYISRESPAPSPRAPPRAFFTFGPTYHVPRPSPRRTSRRDFEPASPEAREELFNRRRRPTAANASEPTSETNSPSADHPQSGSNTPRSGSDTPLPTSDGS
ncbi:uncharacterized protein BDZ99DRAFT_524392 [Mytilinidion resinicola]|uniref:Uncharacterized protein n=1 Tax=Mytilinidion resinicola TaxID=574789 RepID=A0A6A6Y9W7_9PEZI|nr:uncharacterized protein BDZ99DRAFT_524392 [Mytilinidion resinicola]KAF2805419.1 hypothetical protein BDZ99DRAFT_524392 [Mytilinidion resinicola]